MRFHWYWPFARREELDWARATLRPGEELVVQVIDRAAAPASAQGSSSLQVVRDLPDVAREVSRLRWPASRAATYLARSKARRALWRAHDFDLVHLHYVNRFTDAWGRFPQPLVMSVHDAVPHLPRLGRSERLVLRRVYERPDAIVVHHASIGARLESGFDVDPSRIHVVPHQVFPVPGPPSDPPEGPPVVLFFGALRSNKGLEVLDAALHLTRLDARVVVAGRGEPAVERLATAMAGRDMRVEAEIGHASLERKRELFRSASMVVLPYTRFTSQSGVLHDAYGHGRPVVVSDVGALGAAVREDRTGLVVPPGDPVALAGALDALADVGVRRPFEEAARRVATVRSPEAVGAQLRSVYDVVLGGAKRS